MRRPPRILEKIGNSGNWGRTDRDAAKDRHLLCCGAIGVPEDRGPGNRVWTNRKGAAVRRATEGLLILAAIGLTWCSEAAADVFILTNGGRVVGVLGEVVMGRRLSDRWIVALGCASFIVLVVFSVRIVYADVLWIWDLFAG